MRKINTMISTIRSIYDEIGNYLPAGNYYYEVKDYNNGIFVGVITNSNGSFGTYRFSSTDLVKMMAVGQSRLITNTNMRFETGMPNYPVPMNIPSPSIRRIRSRYVYQSRLENNVIANRDTETTNRRHETINRRVNRNIQEPSYNCTICMDEITRYDKKILNCNHNFHRTCINEWLRENDTCPICRAPQTINNNTLYDTSDLSSSILNSRISSTISFLRRNRVYSPRDELDRSYRENIVFYRHK